jgi:hypothetical protein
MIYRYGSYKLPHLNPHERPRCPTRATEKQAKGRDDGRMMKAAG